MKTTTIIARIASALGHGGAEYLRINIRDCATLAEALCASAMRHFQDEADSAFAGSALLSYAVTAETVSAVTCTGRTSWCVHRDGTVEIKRRDGGRWVLEPGGFSGPDDPALLAGAARTIAHAVLGGIGFAAAFPRTAEAESHERAEYEARERASRVAADADNAAWTIKDSDGGVAEIYLGHEEVTDHLEDWAVEVAHPGWVTAYGDDGAVVTVRTKEGK